MRKYTATIQMKVNVWTDSKKKVEQIIRDNVPYVGRWTGDESIESMDEVEIIGVKP